MNRFKLFLISVAAGAALLANAAGLEVNVSVTPKSVAAGELVHYTLTTNLPGLRNLAFPRLENGRWLTNSISQSTRIVNGVGSYSYTIPIQPQREGTLTIPRVNPDLCIGCGGCESICPVRPERAIIVKANEVHKFVEKPKEEEVKKVEIDDFGF